MTVQFATASGSPFDALRRLDHDGEYWLARDLMPRMGYLQWRQFNEAVDRAKIAAGNIGEDVDSIFADARKNAGQAGRDGKDYRLSRFACYLTALNCDPRKPQVAAAQAYFAIRTREAELGQGANRTVLFAELAHAVLDAERQAALDSANAVAIPLDTLHDLQLQVWASWVALVEIISTHEAAHRRTVPSSSAPALPAQRHL